MHLLPTLLIAFSIIAHSEFVDYRGIVKPVKDLRVNKEGAIENTDLKDSDSSDLKEKKDPSSDTESQGIPAVDLHAEPKKKPALGNFFMNLLGDLPGVVHDFVRYSEHVHRRHQERLHHFHHHHDDGTNWEDGRLKQAEDQDEQPVVMKLRIRRHEEPSKFIDDPPKHREVPALVQRGSQEDEGDDPFLPPFSSIFPGMPRGRGFIIIRKTIAPGEFNPFGPLLGDPFGTDKLPPIGLPITPTIIHTRVRFEDSKEMTPTPSQTEKSDENVDKKETDLMMQRLKKSEEAIEALNRIERQLFNIQELEKSGKNVTNSSIENVIKSWGDPDARTNMTKLASNQTLHLEGIRSVEEIHGNISTLQQFTQTLESLLENKTQEPPHKSEESKPTILSEPRFNRSNVTRRIHSPDIALGKHSLFGWVISHQILVLVLLLLAIMLVSMWAFTSRASISLDKPTPEKIAGGGAETEKLIAAQKID